MQNAAAVRRQLEARAALDMHRKAAAQRETELVAALQDADSDVAMLGSGLDLEMIDMAERIIAVSDYEKGGSDRASCIQQAVKQFATGAEESPWLDLWKVALGTKSYDRWHGQRCDCQYGTGPRHGSIIFQIRVHADVRKNRKQSDLTADEVDACVYYLMNIERIQQARKTAQAA